MLEKLREREKQIWKKQRGSAEIFKEDLRFHVIWESSNVVEKQGGLLFKDGVTVDRAVTAEAWGPTLEKTQGFPETDQPYWGGELQKESEVGRWAPRSGLSIDPVR